MADVVVIEFSRPDAGSIYRNVNRILGLDEPGGEWPAGLISHVAGEAGDKLVVVEVWASQADQQAFMESRLGAAFHEADVPQPSRIEWVNHAGDWHRH